MVLVVAALAFEFEISLSPTANITGHWQKVQPEDPWKVPIQIQLKSQISIGKLFSPYFNFGQSKSVVQSPLPISIDQ